MFWQPHFNCLVFLVFQFLSKIEIFKILFIQDTFSVKPQKYDALVWYSHDNLNVSGEWGWELPFLFLFLSCDCFEVIWANCLASGAGGCEPVTLQLSPERKQRVKVSYPKKRGWFPMAFSWLSFSAWQHLSCLNTLWNVENVFECHCDTGISSGRALQLLKYSPKGGACCPRISFDWWPKQEKYPGRGHHRGMAECWKKSD